MRRPALIVTAALALSSWLADFALAQDAFSKTVIPSGIPMADGRKLASDLVILPDANDVTARYTDGSSERLIVLRCSLPGTRQVMPLLFKPGQPKRCPGDLIPLN